jgi:tetratricopeptide (TPR) repeat protein
LTFPLIAGTLLGCNPQTQVLEEANHASKKGSAEKADEPAVDQTQMKELNRLEEEAETAVTNKDWITAKQLVRQGIEESEKSRDLDTVTARFLLLKGEIALQTGDQTSARRYFTDAMAIFHVRKNDPGRFETFMALGRLEARSGDYAAAERQFQEAGALKPKVQNKALLAKFLVDQGHLAARQMAHKRAAALYTEALTIFDAIKDNRLRAETLLLLAAEEDMLGRLGSSKQSLNRAAKLFQDAEDLDGKVRAVHRLATYAEREKKYAVARRLFTEALELYQKLDQQTAATSVERHLSALPVPENDSKKKK